MGAGADDVLALGGLSPPCPHGPGPGTNVVSMPGHLGRQVGLAWQGPNLESEATPGGSPGASPGSLSQREEVLLTGNLICGQSQGRTMRQSLHPI